VYLALTLYVRRKRPAWLSRLQRRRGALLLALVLAAIAIKLSEDVLGGEAGPIDRSVLLLVRAHVPSGLDAFFAAVTLSGASRILFPLTTVCTFGLLLARRYRDAALLAVSVITAAGLVYGIKAIVARERPSLWETQWYWGSSFPSGHTMVVAAFATAAALIVSRAWPAARPVSLSVAFAWIALMALSRLVLGVHWPTDVLTAACIGASLPIAITIALDLRSA
jgi:undecaprenyl-diphosphatase